MRCIERKKKKSIIPSASSQVVDNRVRKGVLSGSILRIRIIHGLCKFAKSMGILEKNKNQTPLVGFFKI